MPPKRPEQLRDFRFPSGLGWDLATIDCDAADLAARLGVELERWEEDGLGWASGFALGAAAIPTLVAQQDHAATLDSRRSTTIAIDGREAASNGHRAALDRVTLLLGLEKGAISWVPENPIEWAEGARRILEARGQRDGTI